MTTMTRRRLLATSGAVAACGATGTSAQAQSRPPVEVELALRRAGVPREALAAVVQDVGSARSRLALNAQQPMNPASLEKLLTTQAALDLLGPAYTWRTPVWLDGRIVDGDVLEGRVIIKGTGDPKLVAERVWLLMHRVRALGVRAIRGDIVLDQSAFDIADVSPGQFDNEPLRPYNVRPQALVVAQKSLVLTFTPQPSRGVASVQALPALDGMAIDATVPLAAAGEPCADWRGRLDARREVPSQLRFGGTYAASCGERTWAVAHADPAQYNARAITAAWKALGGTLEGEVRESRVPIAPAASTLPPTFEFESPALAEVVRDINKHSLNTAAQQLFLTLALAKRGTGTWSHARDVLRQWLVDVVKTSPQGLTVENGSGLSRESRVSALQLARVLQHAWRGTTMPELMASLPATGVDGTLRRSQLGQGRAHLKTGSLDSVAGIAGYVLGASGKRYVLVAIVNHAAAQAARPALDALVQWTADDFVI